MSKLRLHKVLLKERREPDLLVLVGGDGGEHGLGEAEGLDPVPARHRLVLGQLAAEVLPDDVDPRLVLVHGVEDDLQDGEKFRNALILHRIYTYPVFIHNVCIYFALFCIIFIHILYLYILNAFIWHIFTYIVFINLVCIYFTLFCIVFNHILYL